MRYKKAIEMTSEMIERLESGDVRLNAGQWVRWGKTLSRFIGVTPAGILWMEHSRHPKKTVFDPIRFNSSLSSYRKIMETNKKIRARRRAKQQQQKN